MRCTVPAPSIEHQPAVLINAVESPGKRAVRQVDGNLLSYAAGDRAPLGNDLGDAVARGSRCPALPPWCGTDGQRVRPATRCALGLRDTSPGRAPLSGHDRDIDAATDDQRMTAIGKPFAFKQNAAGLLAAIRMSFGHLTVTGSPPGGNTAGSPDARRRRRPAAANDSLLHRRRIDQKQRGVEVAAAPKPRHGRDGRGPRLARPR